MTENRVLIDPTSEQLPPLRHRAPRLVSLKDRTIALLDISKARGDIFLDHIAEKLSQKGGAVKRYKKPTFARVAPIDLKQEISTQCHAIVEALAD